MQYVWLYVYEHCVVLRVTEHTDCSYSVEANSCLASQDVLRISWNLKIIILGSSGRCPYSEPVNPRLPSCLSENSLNVFPSIPRSSKWWL